MAKSTNVPSVRCPRCGRAQRAGRPSVIYWCDHCRVQFDDDPDEGGTYSDRNPGARMEREERRRIERRK